MQKDEWLYVQIGKNWINVELGTLLEKDGKIYRRDITGWSEIEREEYYD